MSSRTRTRRGYPKKDGAGNWQITVAGLDSPVYRFVNDDVAPHLTLVKTVTNDNSGTALPTDWTLTATTPGGPEPDRHHRQWPPSPTQPVKAGVVYTIGESGPRGYDLASLSCTGHPNTTAAAPTLTLRRAKRHLHAAQRRRPRAGDDRQVRRRGLAGGRRHRGPSRTRSSSPTRAPHCRPASRSPTPRRSTRASRSCRRAGSGAPMSPTCRSARRYRHVHVRGHRRSERDAGRSDGSHVHAGERRRLLQQRDRQLPGRHEQRHRMRDSGQARRTEDGPACRPEHHHRQLDAQLHRHGVESLDHSRSRTRSTTPPRRCPPE